MKTSLNLAIKSLYTNWSKTALSLLGVVVGVIAIILVISLGAGLKEFVLKEVESFGSNIIEIEAKVPGTKQTSGANASGAGAITTFKLKEAERVAQYFNLGDWYAGKLDQAVASHSGKDQQIMIFGVTSGIEKVDANFEIANGRMYSEEEDKALKQVVVLGAKLKNDLFESEKAVGKRIKIKQQTYLIVGVLKERGSSGFFDWDSLAYLPIRTLQKKISGIDHIAMAVFKIKDMSQVELTTVDLENIMREQHNIENAQDDDFGVMPLTEAVDMIESIFKTLNALLIALTLISLVVGGVGITNVMYVAVSERTFEIGLRKSLGARPRDIMQQFIIEAVLLTFLGGLLGVGIGFVLTKIMEYIIAKFNFFLSFPLSLGAILLALSFSILVGLIFGMKPALSAAKLSPMEALRKE